MMKRFYDAPYRVFLAFTAAALILLFVVKNLRYTGLRRAYRKNGSLVEYTYTVADFTQNSLAERGEYLIATDSDPQLVREWPAQAIDTITFYMEAEIYPGEMVVYYTEDAAEPFSEKKRVWITPTDRENVYTANLGLKKIRNIRIDPTMYAGNRMIFGDFVFNVPRSLADNFRITYGDIFNLIVYTGFISGLLKLLAEVLSAFDKNKNIKVRTR